MKNIFWMRTEAPDPGRDAIRKRTQKQEQKNLTDAIPTLFDLVDYFAQTGRTELCPDIAHYDRFAAESALLKDLEVEQDPKKRLKIRKLILTANRQGYPHPEKNAEEIRELLLERSEMSNLEMRRTADPEEAENWRAESELWGKFITMLNERLNKTGNTEDALTFVEEKLTDAYKNLAMRPKSRPVRILAEKMEKIRNAFYWNFIYNPDSR